MIIATNIKRKILPSTEILYMVEILSPGSHASLSEWLRSLTRNQMGSARTGSNPVARASFSFFFYFTSNLVLLIFTINEAETGFAIRRCLFEVSQLFLQNTFSHSHFPVFTENFETCK